MLLSSVELENFTLQNSHTQTAFMKNILMLVALFLVFISCSPSKQETNTTTVSTPTVQNTSNQDVMDYLNIPGPVHYDGKDFKLAWSSHPTPEYYKQEYLPGDEKPESYNQMILIELAIGDLNVKDIAASKKNEIESRKAGDPVASYQSSTEKSGDDIFDFMLSQDFGLENGIVEWNVYRYIPYTDSSGKKGIALYALSQRAYGKNSEAFVSDIKANREKYISTFLSSGRPEIKLK